MSCPLCKHSSWPLKSLSHFNMRLTHFASSANTPYPNSRGVTQGLRGLKFRAACLYLHSDLHAEGTDTADQIRIGGETSKLKSATFPIAAAQVPLVTAQAFAPSSITSAAAGGGIPSGLAARQQLVEQPLLSIVWQQLRGKKRSTIDVGLKASKPITPGTLLRSIALLNTECRH